MVTPGTSTADRRGSICFAHIRFRQAMKVQNQNLDDIPFQAILGVWGSYFGLFFSIVCVIAQFIIAVSPIGSPPNANDFFVNMLALPIILVLFVGWKLWKKTKFVKASEADLITGRRELDLAAVKAEERAEQATWSTWKKYFPYLKWADMQGLLLVVLNRIWKGKFSCLCLYRLVRTKESSTRRLGWPEAFRACKLFELTGDIFSFFMSLKGGLQH